MPDEDGFMTEEEFFDEMLRYGDDPLAHLPAGFPSEHVQWEYRGDYMTDMIRRTLFDARELARWCGPVITSGTGYDLPSWIPRQAHGSFSYLIGFDIVPMLYEIANEELRENLEAGEFVANGCLLLTSPDQKGLRQITAQLSEFLEEVMLSELVAVRLAEITPRIQTARNILDAVIHRLEVPESGAVKELYDRAILFGAVLDRVAGHRSAEKHYAGIDRVFEELYAGSRKLRPDAPHYEKRYAGFSSKVDALMEEIHARMA